MGFACTSSLKNVEGFEARNVPGGLDQEGGGDPQEGLKISQARVFGARYNELTVPAGSPVIKKHTNRKVEVEGRNGAACSVD